MFFNRPLLAGSSWLVGAEFGVMNFNESAFTGAIFNPMIPAQAQFGFRH
jgi:hypothetical protein